MRASKVRRRVSAAVAFNRGDVVEMLAQMPSSVMGGHGHVLAFALHGPASQWSSVSRGMPAMSTTRWT